VNGARSVRELYDLSRDTEGKYTVPVLWDKRTGTIVNNESGDILKMLNENFNFLAMNPNLNLKPLELAKAVDQYNVWLHENINDGVYKCGFATSQAAYEEAVEGVVGAMDHAEALLGRQRYLLGDRLTEADLRLFPTLVRFDEVRRGGREGGREGGIAWEVEIFAWGSIDGGGCTVVSDVGAL